MREKVALRVLKLRALNVTRDRDHFDPVAKWFRDHIDVVCRADKNDLRKIERDVEVTINERMILCRIEHFKQCACRVATKIRTDFVDLVEHENRIARAATAQFLNDSSGH